MTSSLQGRRHTVYSDVDLPSVPDSIVPREATPEPVATPQPSVPDSIVPREATPEPVATPQPNIGLPNPPPRNKEDDNFMYFRMIQNSGILRWLVIIALIRYVTCWGGLSTIASFLDPVTCKFKGECCTDEFIKLDSEALKRYLDARVYGQHLAKAAILQHLKAHARGDPSKALSLSFHGGRGTGKNLVGSLIAENIYRKGMNSEFVHIIVASNEFPNPDMVDEYKVKLKEKIEQSVSKCERSMFIFDEIDKMPPGILDIVKPYLDFYQRLNGVDYRKSIFIFLSNTAGKAIQKKVIAHWRDGREREELTLVDMEQLIITEALNEKSGLFHSNLLLHQMVSAHVPFLPLERKHVRECIKDILIARNCFRRCADVRDEDVREIAAQLSYYPQDEEVFSVTGCKRVADKVDYVMAYDRLKRDKN